MLPAERGERGTWDLGVAARSPCGGDGKAARLTLRRTFAPVAFGSSKMDRRVRWRARTINFPSLAREGDGDLVNVGLGRRRSGPETLVSKRDSRGRELIEGADDWRPADASDEFVVVVVVVVVVVRFRRVLEVGRGGKAEVGGAMDGGKTMGRAAVAIFQLPALGGAADDADQTSGIELAPRMEFI